MPYPNATGCYCPDKQHYTGSLCQSLLCENGGNQVGSQCVCSVWFTGTYCRDRSSIFFGSWSVVLAISSILIAVVLRRLYMLVRSCFKCANNGDDIELDDVTRRRHALNDLRAKNPQLMGQFFEDDGNNAFSNILKNSSNLNLV